MSFSVDAVVAGDRAGALAHRPGGEQCRPGVREIVAELLMRAALDGDLAVVRRLVTCQYVHVDVADRTGNTPLHCAAVSNFTTSHTLNVAADLSSCIAKGKKVKVRSIAVRKQPHRYGNSRAIWDHTVLPATRQR